MNAKTALVLVGLIAGSAPGCTYRAWYTGFQERQRQECYELADRSEIDRCLERVDSTTYDEYRKERARAGRPAE